MTVSVSRPSTIDVTKVNPREILYIKGDANTNGSLRLMPDVTDENFEFQLRQDDVWNDTGIQIAASTIHLGRDLQMSGAGEFIRTTEVINDTESLVPHVTYDDDGTEIAHTPILGPKFTRFIVQSDDASEITGTTLVSTNDTNKNTINAKKLTICVS